MFVVPSLDQCVQRTRAAFRAYLPGTDAWIWPNNINPTAKVVGGAVSELHGRLDFISRQKFALTASGKYLERHGAELGIPRRDAASASGTLIATAPDAIAVASGAQLQRSDGVVVTATAAATLGSAGTLSVPVIAATAALAGNAEAGTPFAVLSGFSGPGAAGATVVADGAGLTGGLDREVDGPFYSSDLGTYRGRILFRKRNPPQGGCPSDYVLWATAVPGVTRVFVERLYNGPGSVRVFPLFDGLFRGGVADDAHIALVRDAIAPLQPAAADVLVMAPKGIVVPVTLKGVTPNTSAVDEAIEAELADTFQRLGQVAGTDDPVPSMPYLATPYSFAALWVEQAVANATGAKRAVVVRPTVDIAIPVGAVPVFDPAALNIAA